MKKKVGIISIICVFLLIPAFVHSEVSDFDKGVVYLLLEDYPQSKIHFTEYFRDFPNPIVKRGFMLLTDKDKKKAKTEFQSYLNMNFRSLHAIVGISLALSDIRQSTSKENLQKAIRLDKGFASAYACLGMEYLKEMNYPMAEKHLRAARNIRNIPEYRILQGEAYLRNGRPDMTISLIENDVENNPENFFLNYLFSRALFRQNRIGKMAKYITISMDLNRTNKDVQLLYAKYLLRKGDKKEARDVLKNMRYQEVNPEYVKLYAETLLSLGNKRAKNFLYQYFTMFRWDRDINRFLGLYYFRNKAEKSNIQNWIYRAVLSGNSPESLKKQFSDDYHFPELTRLRFFDLKKVFWIDNQRFFAVGTLHSGGSEKLYLVDFDKKKVVSSYSYSGLAEGVYFSGTRDRIILETEDPASRKTRLYAMVQNRNGSYQFRTIYTGNVNVLPYDVVFNRSGTTAYFIDKQIKRTAFESPFSIVNRFGEKRPVYTGLSNFAIYKYSFVSRRFRYVEEMDEIRIINSPTLKKFLMVYNASTVTREIRKLIEKGEKLDSFSSETVKVVFSRNLDSFLIYLADLKNSLQGVIFENETGKIIRVDSSMFLDKGRFAELEIVNFDSRNKYLILSTRDKRRELIQFNYRSRLYRKLVENYYRSCFSKDNRFFYILTERNRRYYLTETLLKIISTKPFWVEELPSRRDLKSITNCTDLSALRMDTNEGEFLEMGLEHNFVYISPSYEGSLFGYSSDRKRTAVYINKNLFLIDNESAWAGKPTSTE